MKISKHKKLYNELINIIDGRFGSYYSIIINGKEYDFNSDRYSEDLRDKCKEFLEDEKHLDEDTLKEIEEDGGFENYIFDNFKDDYYEIIKEYDESWADWILSELDIKYIRTLDFEGDFRY